MQRPPGCFNLPAAIRPAWPPQRVSPGSALALFCWACVRNYADAARANPLLAPGFGLMTGREVNTPAPKVWQVGPLKVSFKDGVAHI